MKTSDARHPVMASWLYDREFRLDPGPFLSDAIQARALITDLGPPKGTLSTLTQGRIFHPGRVRRQWVTDPDHGVPFFSSTDILEADFSRLGLIATKSVTENPQLILGRDWTLITRSGSIGRMAYSRRTMDGKACTEHVLRVVPDPAQILPGYLYAFLSSRYGRALVMSFTYETIVQHIEPHHIADLEVPRLGSEREEDVHALIEHAAELRVQFQEGIEDATRDLFESAGLPELLQLRWHDQPKDLGFTAPSVNPRTLRALNYAPRYQDIVKRIQAVPHGTLGQICVGGQLARPGRFRRVPADEGHGVQLIGQRQGFWVRPEGRWIASLQCPPEVFAHDETIMIAAQGTLGENEVFCQAILTTGSWLDYAYTEHFLRVYSNDDSYPGAYLFAFLRSAAAFRCLRSMSTGSKQQDLHPGLLADFPVPTCTATDRRRIAEKVREAYRRRDQADREEDAAIETVERAIRGV